MRNNEAHQTDNSEKKSLPRRDDLDDYVLEVMLEDEIREFRRLIKLQKLLDIQKQNPQYFI